MRNLSYYSLFLGALFFFSGTTLSAQQVPSIDSQSVIPVFDEDNNVTIDINNLVITDDDPPTDFTLNIKEGEGYSVIDNTTVLPNTNLNGQIAVTITVSDVDDGESLEFSYLVDINAVNDVPSVTGQFNTDVEIDEETPMTILAADLIIEDPDTEDTHTVIIESGDNYTFNDNEFTPFLDYYGPLAVNLHVSDGTDDSDTYTYLLNVANVNDLPAVVSQVNSDVEIPEESMLVIEVGDLNIEDADPDDTHTVVVEAGSNYDFSGNTVTPDEDYFGPLNVNLRVDDGTGLSEQFVYQLTVTNDNDAPTLGIVNDVLLVENGPSGDALLSGISSGADNESQALVVSVVSNSNPALFDGSPVITYISPNESGTVTFTPAADMFGDATITVRVSEEGESEFVEQTFTVSVAEGSDPLEITGQEMVSVNEDESFLILTSHLSIQGADEPSALSIQVLAAGANYTFSGSTITPSPDYNGSLTIPIRVTDGSSTSPQFSFELTVNSINDAPTIAPVSNVSMDEDADQLGISLSGITAGGGENQALTVSASSDSPWLFETFTIVYTSPSTTGTLNVKPTLNAFGTAMVTVTVTDNGLTGSPHVNTVTTSFNITVNPVNDPPLITGQDAVSVDEDNTFTILADHLTIIDHDDDENFTVTVNGNGPNYTASGNTITPNPDYFGSLTIPITVSDGSPGGDTSYDFILPVNPINDAPTIAGPATINIDENAPETGFPLTGISAGPFENQGLTLLASADNAALFEVLAVEYNGPSTTGTLNVKPAPNMSGTTNARVTVTDDGPSGLPHVNSAFVDITINVNDVILPPVILGQNTTPSTNEETGITLDISHLNVLDADNPGFPTDFELNVKPGTGYTVGTGTNITPNADVTGTISVVVSVTDPDGIESLLNYNFQVDVIPVNDDPIITGQNTTPSTDEETPIAINIAHLNVTDVDNPGFPSGFTLNVKPGTGYTFSGNTVTPNNEVSGTIDVVVSVTDPDGGESNNWSFEVTVNAVNDDPVITGQNTTPSTDEETPIAINIAHLVVTDADNPGFPSGFALNVKAGTGYTASGNIVTPNANVTGPINVVVSVTDPDGGESNDWNFEVTVNGVNDAPVITGQNTTPSTDEETPIAINIAHLNVTDVDNPGFPTGFTLNVKPGTGYTFSGNTVTPNDEVSGTIEVVVSVTDPDGGESNNWNFEVTVNSVNDPPLITGQNTTPTTDEETPLAINIAHLNVTDADNPGFPAGFSLNVKPGADYTAAGTTITPNANVDGTISVVVSVTDPDGGESPDFNFQVTVNGINDAPVITGQNTTPSTNEETPIVININHLIVTDPDDPFPTNFTLNVKPGTNYTAAGTTVTPDPDVVDPISVVVSVTDPNGAESNNYNFQVTINPVNDPPVIIGQVAASVNEDNNFTIVPGHLTIEDPDNNSGFTVNAGAGTNYTVTGAATIVPAANYYGTLTIPITVSDGTSPSTPFNFMLTVNPVNDAPVITGHQPINIDEAEPFELLVSQITIVDPDIEDVYPDDFTLTILSGSDYSVTGTTITPIANFSGILEVPVFVRDPANAISNTFTINISVNAVNDPPIITGQAIALNINEDQSVVLNLSQLTVVDPDTPPAQLTLVVQNGPNYTFSGLTVTPAANFNGPLNVSVVVNDGELNSTAFNMLVTVNPVNDAPVITGQNPVTTTEDVPVTLTLGDLVVVDPDANDPYPEAFTMTASPGANYTLSGPGNLTVTPALDFTGTLSVPVVVNDGDVNSNIFNLQIQVTDENDIPIINSQVPLQTEEDVPVVIEFSHLNVTDTDNTYPDDFTIVIQSGANYTYSGTTITPALDFQGTLTVNLRVNDGQNNSAVFPFQITVVGDNDPPVITGQKALSVAEDQPITIKLTDLTVVDPDPEDVYPGDFTMTLAAGTNYTVEGTTVQPAANYFGPITVPVRVNDGVHDSDPFNLVITVTPVNDPPSINPIDNLILAENTEDYAVQITGISAGPLENQTLDIIALSSDANLMDNPVFSPAYTGGSTATILLNPKPNKTGTVTVTIRVTDPGLLVATQTFTVNIENINDPPTLNPITFNPIPEDSPEQTVPLSGITAGPGESQVLTVSATADNPDLFEEFEVIYTSPQTTGSIVFLPAANAFGTAVVSVTVTDDGSDEGPHENSITRQFTIEITPAPDPPLFVSEPVELALIGEAYQYMVEVVDVDQGAVVTLEAVQIPAWLTLTATGNGKATLAGTPPPGSSGQEMISLKATDDDDAEATQDYVLIVDARPIVSDFSITANEDEAKIIEKLRFDAAFQDPDNDMIEAVKIVTLPEFGQLFLGSQAVNVDQEISAAALPTLAYKGLPNYADKDTIVWTASDGNAYATVPAKIYVTITPVNDPPEIVNLETDVLTVNAGEGPKEISTVFEAVDVDNEFLTRAEIAFRPQNFVAGEDLLVFDNTPKITGEYNESGGILVLTGTATVAEYNTAIRTVRYDNVSEVFSTAEVNKTIAYTVSDGVALSITRNREIKLVDTFEELTIPNGFTPNSDGDNDTWFITNINRHVDASVRVYTMMGQIVYTSDGFYEGWDGTYNGQLLPTDTYYYTIDLNLPFRKKVYKGAVTLLR